MSGPSAATSAASLVRKREAAGRILGVEGAPIGIPPMISDSTAIATDQSSAHQSDVASDGADGVGLCRPRAGCDSWHTAATAVRGDGRAKTSPFVA